jgi:RNA polymerase sigma-70 factor (ECF subfamily)
MTTRRQQLIAEIPRLRRYARALWRGDVVTADDLVQDCLARALSRLDRWQTGTDLRAWLFTMMHNLYVNQLRRAANAPVTVAMTADDAVAVTAPPGAGLELAALHQAIGALPPDQREILLMVALEGLSYRQVADILGIPEGTVMSRLSRTRHKLRRVIERELQPRVRRVK